VRGLVPGSTVLDCFHRPTSPIKALSQRPETLRHRIKRR
jgi:hypothetical protein